ncbi:MAG: PQQ-dependent sugar dehydrogenase [Pseudomonadota bacterium]
MSTLRRRWWQATAAMLCLAAAPIAADEAPAYSVRDVADGLSFPWCVAFLPDGDLLVTERTGTLKRIHANGVSAVEGVPAVYARSQGGLFDVLLHPEFASNKQLFLSYAHGPKGANALRVARATLDGDALTDLEVIFEVAPTKNTPVHYGGRMALLPDHTLLVNTGDGFDFREAAQRLDNLLGKTVRINLDGTVPTNNPFAGRSDARAEIWTYGHRNAQGLAVDPATGAVWQHEHGPRGGDELNALEAGENYGWPVITWGIDYSGARISPYTEREGMRQPLVHWTPSIAPAGMTLYDGDAFPAWRGDLFVSALVERSVRRVRVRDGSVTEQQLLFTELDERMRDVRTGPDGCLYLLTDSEEGRVVKVCPAGVAREPKPQRGRKADATVWPRPAGLEKDIAFWRHVYTSLSSAEGVVHDSRHLERVYATVQLPVDRWSRAADREIDKANRNYRAILKKLAGNRTGALSDAEQAVLALFPSDVSDATLRQAAAHVRFQRGQSDRFREGLRRSGAWLPYIHQRLKERDLPPELAVLPHVESSFNAAVYSEAGAAGLWQITRSTGRHYLRIDHVVDERLDPFRATEAALTILAQNRRATGTWPLAITAYNHGPGGVRQAARKLETDDIEIILREHRSRRFGFASRNFYVAFLAANDVVAGAADYFGEFDVSPPAVHGQVMLDDYVPAAALADALNVDTARLRALNPSLRPMVWTGDKRVPKGFALTLPRSDVDYDALLAGIDIEHRFDEQIRDDVYTVRQGDTLSAIGRRYGLSAAHIASVNGLRSRHRIRVGQVLRLPPAASAQLR